MSQPPRRSTPRHSRTSRLTPGRAAAPLLCAGVALFVAGCTSVITPGNIISEHAHGSEAEPDRAPSDGTYTLYSKYGVGTPYHTIGLKAGDSLGFRTAKTGQIDVVAGDDEWTMTDGDYIWKRN